ATADRRRAFTPPLSGRVRYSRLARPFTGHEVGALPRRANGRSATSPEASALGVAGMDIRRPRHAGGTLARGQPRALLHSRRRHDGTNSGRTRRGTASGVREAPIPCAPANHFREERVCGYSGWTEIPDSDG